MKSYSLLAAAFALGLALVSGDADAGKRFGGSKSFGMQRDASTPQKSNTNTTTQKADSAQPATPSSTQAAAQPRRSWMGPVAGLAAGLGLAALASHLGLGEEFANFLMIALLGMAVLMAISYFMRRRGAANQPRASGLQYAAAGNGAAPGRKVFDIAQPGSSGAAVAPATAASRIPADFDVDGFVRNAKLGFIRLQAANDAGDLEDIRAFTSPEVFAEIKMSLVERGQAAQQTDVVELEAELLEVVEEDGRYIASVHFSGLIREERDAEPFSEIWHVGRPLSGKSGWIVLGIQQVQ